MKIIAIHKQSESGLLKYSAKATCFFLKIIFFRKTEHLDRIINVGRSSIANKIHTPAEHSVKNIIKNKVLENLLIY